ncbi:hypothetical protein KIH07_03025 [Hydrogenophaga taeniospiralis]|uniref:hypothetical protein n=1 Tax=Hydrogenophaga taeniospiralis TaxID=65656 RepID=UPI001CF984FE|nr:hypothetical protein [Hydrogenophaga taeniospiralis]MCB4362689.1 hypothetical protein [Hydrogenophaga taeniospiralis]
MSLPNRFDNTETGAPVLNNVNGGGIAVMLACLRDGFNVKAVTSITVAAGVATVQCPAHGFACGQAQLIKITGASVPALNADHQPTLVDANNFSVPAVGVADGSYTATDARRAPLGWTEEFNNGLGTKSIFRRSAPDALAAMLRVDDSVGASMMRVRAVDAATGIDALTGLTPTDAQVNGGAYWQKGADSATAKKWFIVGDSRGFFFGTQLGTNDRFVVYFFGDGVPYYPGDGGFTLLAAQTNTSYTATPAWGLAAGTSQVGSPGVGNAIYAPSGVLPGEAGSQYQAAVNPSGGVNVSGYNLFQNPVTYPNPVIHPVIHVLSTGPCIRGQWPGLAYVFANSPFANLQVVDAGADRYLAVSIGVSGQNGQFAIKLSGGWY